MLALSDRIAILEKAEGATWLRSRSASGRTGSAKRKSPYVVDYKDLSGVRRTPQFQRKHQADEFLRKVQHEIFGGVHVPKSQAITFAALGESWIKDCERRHGIGDRMSGNTLNLVVRMVRETSRSRVRHHAGERDHR